MNGSDIHDALKLHVENKMWLQPFHVSLEWRDNKAILLLGRLNEGVQSYAPFEMYFYDTVKTEINVIVT